MMVTQSRISTETSFNFLNIVLVCAGVLIGGVIAFIGLWLWLDYQADPARSLMVLVSSNLVAIMPGTLRAYLGDQARVMDLPLTAHTSAYWYMARSGGIIAYLLLWLSVVWGLALSTKITNRLMLGPFAYGIHEFISILTIVFAVVHSLVLLGDSYVHFSLFNLVIPFTASYQPLWTGLGTTGFYLIATLTASFYLRQHIGQKAWRSLHYLTFLGYVLVLVHGLMSGSDPVKLMYLSTGATVLFLTYYRLFTLKHR
jgi:predicted ferric reductase